MGFYLELHCDIQSNAVDHLGQTKCETARNESPGNLCRNTQIGILRVRDGLVSRAEIRGWKRFPKVGKYQWACPPCFAEIEAERKRAEAAGDVPVSTEELGL